MRSTSLYAYTCLIVRIGTIIRTRNIYAYTHTSKRNEKNFFGRGADKYTGELYPFNNVI